MNISYCPPKTETFCGAVLKDKVFVPPLTSYFSLVCKAMATVASNQTIQANSYVVFLSPTYVIFPKTQREIPGQTERR